VVEFVSDNPVAGSSLWWLTDFG